MKAAREALGVCLVVGLAAAAVASVRPALAGRCERVKETSDSYALPPTEQLEVATLGYKSAAADMIWAYTLVSQGIHFTERRRFEWGAKYFDAVTTLDPTFREPYLFADALLTFGAVKPSADDARAARRILLRGVEARPFDGKIAYTAGSFLAYLADAYIKDPAELEAWHAEGAKLIGRAGELGGAGPGSHLESMVSAKLLSKAGQQDAAASVLERALLATDSEAARNELLPRLQAIRGQQFVENLKNEVQRFDAQWRDAYPFIPRGMFMQLGPPVRPYACAGYSATDEACTRRWPDRIPKG